MSTQRRRHDEDDERDLIDAIPGLGHATSNLQRSAGPSCLLSLIITALLLIVLRRYMKLPLTGMVVMTFLVWWVVMVILLRFGKPLIDEDE